MAADPAQDRTDADAELDRLAVVAVAAVAGDPLPGEDAGDRTTRRVRAVVDAIRAADRG